VTGLLEAAVRLLTEALAATGYPGIVVAMALESACIPLPSEVIMPFAGFLAAQGRFTLWGASLAGAAGCALGSAAAYWVGARGGRTALLRYGRWVLITPAEVERADRFFARYGSAATFLARLLPVIRTFISLPAGVARMPFWPFLFYAFAGSLPWSYALAWAGFILGEHWEQVADLLRPLEGVILVGLVALTGWFLWHRLRPHRAR
jgi:membrane protein DedA with SNARE-associated domain